MMKFQAVINGFHTLNYPAGARAELGFSGVVLSGLDGFSVD